MGSTLKANGYSDKIETSHWNEDWRMRRHVNILGSDGSILEITRANEYIRIVDSSIAPAERPFALYRLRSTNYANRPKTDFLLHEKPVLYMSAEEIALHVINHLKEEYMAMCRSKVTSTIRSSEGWFAALDTQGNWVWVELENFDRHRERADKCTLQGRPADDIIDRLDEIIRSENIGWMHCSSPEGVFTLTY